VPSVVGQVLSSPGQPLKTDTRTAMNESFGVDFGRVRVHTDARAAESARAVQASAYTVGPDVVFAAGRYAPDTPAGRRLLAHELTHVVQQRGHNEERPPAPSLVGEADNALEREADRIAGEVTGTAGFIPRASISRDALGTVRRQEKQDPKAKQPPPWTVDDLKKLLNSCDGGLGIWAKAKKANNNKDPKVTPGGGGWVDTSTGEITLDKSRDKCFATQQLIQELSNLSRKADFDSLDGRALAGDVSREDYIKETEKIEYETGVKNVLTAFDACNKTWGCQTTPKEWARKAKDFDDYYKNLLRDAHKENYGKWWDRECKAAYDKKHAKK
jgi:hypothetical protein